MHVHTEDRKAMHPIFRVSGGDTKMADSQHLNTRSQKTI